MKTFLDTINKNQLTSSELIIMDYMQNNLSTVTYMSLSDLCKKLYVSNATIVRFCQKLGFEGYNELKFYLHNELHLSSLDPLKPISNQLAIINDFIENIEDNLISNICDLIKSNKSIYVYGRNISSLPAKYLYSMLSTLDIPCIFIEWIASLKALAKSLPNNSLLFIFTYYGNAIDYSEIINECHEKNVKIIWITSSEIDHDLININDIYINTKEDNLKSINIQNKTISFTLIQLIIDCLSLK